MALQLLWPHRATCFTVLNLVKASSSTTGSVAAVWEVTKLELGTRFPAFLIRNISLTFSWA